MEEILANVDDIKFEIEHQLENQVGLLLLPFPSMDKSGAAVCTQRCERGNLCPLRHTVGDQTVVCKHWLRGLCKKGDRCEFLHVFDMSKMPECYFFSKFNSCTNKECTFLHIDPSSKKKDCAWYDCGFCRHGPNCRNKHSRRVICPNYLAGFCPAGPECRHVHPKGSKPNEQQKQPLQPQQQQMHHHQQNHQSHNQHPHHMQHHHMQNRHQHHNQQYNHMPHHQQQQHHHIQQQIPVLQQRSYGRQYRRYPNNQQQQQQQHPQQQQQQQQQPHWLGFQNEFY